MIAPTPFFADRGCHVRIYEEAKALKKMGHQVTVVTYHIGQSPKGIKIERIPGIFFWYKKFEAGPSWWKPFLDLALLIKAGQVFLSKKFDIIHAHLHEGVIIGYLIKNLKAKKTPLVFDFQGSLTGELLAHHFIKEHQNLHGFFKSLENVITKMPDFSIVSSVGGYDVLIKDFGVEKDKVKYISDGVGEGFYKRPPEKTLQELKSSLAIPKNSKVVFFIGVLSEYQGLDILLKSAKNIVKKRKNVHFLIAGYPNLRHYERMAYKYGLKNFVTFTGRVPYLDSAKYIALGDIGVSPKISRTEANGKLYYYAAAGLPAVVFDSSVNREILGDLGIYAKFNNQKDYEKKLLFSLDHSKKMLNLSKKLKEKAIRDLSWRESSEDIVKLYKKLFF